MVRIRATLWAVAVFLSTMAIGAADLQLGGYFKSYSIAYFVPSIDTEAEFWEQPDMGAVNNRLRLTLSYHPAPWLSANAAYDLSPRIQDPNLWSSSPFFSVFQPDSYRAWDFNPLLYPGSTEDMGSFGVYHNLDRLFLTFKLKIADITVGRQAIAWGSARVINPTDIIAPFTFYDLDTEERRGVDAVRVRIPLGAMEELDFGYVAGKNLDPDAGAFFMRGKFYLLKTDISLLAIGFQNHLLLGLDISRSLGGAGIWCELAYVIDHALADDSANGGNSYFRTSVGMDHNLGSTTYGFIEYHFSSAGKSDPSEYPSVFQSPAFLEGAVYLMARHYIGAGITHQLTPLIPLTGFVLLNLNDFSLSFSPQIEYNIAENIYISLGAYLGFGQGPKIEGPPDEDSIPDLRSEFGTYPDMAFASFRIYF